MTKHILALTVLLATVHAVAATDATAPSPRERRAFSGHSGQALSWCEILARAADAEVVIVAEKHDDAAGHAVQHAISEDLFDRNRRWVLALEMLERDEQETVDAYLAGRLDLATFKEKTGAASWFDWDRFYQPVIDAARARGRRVVAANAPRRLVSRARKEGYEGLVSNVSREDRRLFALPPFVKQGGYYQRFRALMGAHHPTTKMPNDAVHQQAAKKKAEQSAPANPHAPTPAAPSPHAAPPAGNATPPAGTPPPGHGHGHGHAMPPGHGTSMIDGLYRSQLVWDATMAESVMREVRAGRRVILLVGQFHTDFDGGLVEFLRHHRRGLKLLTVSLQPGDNASLADDDRGRADIVIYTGTPPAPE